MLSSIHIILTCLNGLNNMTGNCTCISMLQNASLMAPSENSGLLSTEMESSSFWASPPVMPQVISPISSMGSPQNEMSPHALQFLSPVLDGSTSHNIARCDALSSPINSVTLPQEQYNPSTKMSTPLSVSPPDVSAYCSAVESSHSSPDMLGKLESALQGVCHQSAIPFALFSNSDTSSDASDAAPVSVRVGVLQMHFMMQSTKSKTRVIELQQFYRLQAAQLESDRYAALCHTQPTPWLLPNINSFYDQQHHALIDRIEKSLHLLESPGTTKRKAETQVINISPIDQHSPSISPPSGGSHVVRTSTRTSPVLNAVAVRIMTNWYERNKEHPYPSYATAEVIGKAGDVSVEQVKKWFANRRMRGRNTKTLTQIAQRRQKKS